jgi:hypothetical protein
LAIYSRKGFADKHFIMPAAVKIARVDQIDAGIERGVDSSNALGAVGGSRQGQWRKQGPSFPRVRVTWGFLSSFNLARGKGLRKSQNEIWIAAFECLECPLSPAELGLWTSLIAQ